MEEISNMIEMFYFFIVAVVTWVYRLFKTHRNVHIKWVHCIYWYVIYHSIKWFFWKTNKQTKHWLPLPYSTSMLRGYVLDLESNFSVPSRSWISFLFLYKENDLNVKELSQPLITYHLRRKRSIPREKLSQENTVHIIQSNAMCEPLGSLHNHHRADHQLQTQEIRMAVCCGITHGP